MATAVRLDPSLEGVGITVGGLLEPQTPLYSLAGDSSGRVIRDAEALGKAVADLGRRLRLTFQMPGAPDGLLHEVRVHRAGSEKPIASPGWVRSSTPPTASVARARRLLVGHGTSGDLGLEVGWDCPDSEGEPQLRVRLANEGFDGQLAGRSAHRVTVAVGQPDAPVATSQFAIEESELSGEGWTRRLDSEASSERWVAVVVDDLATGRWGGELLERVSCPAPM
jgi:hypothetical protein